MMPLQIVTGEGFAEKLESWRRDPEFASLDEHPVYGAFGRSYFPAVFAARRSQSSFAVMAGDRPLAIVPCTFGEAELDYFGVPVRIFLRSGLEGNEAQRAVTAVFTHLDTIVAAHGISRVTIRDDDSLGTLSLVGKQALNRRASADVRLTGLCTLDAGEAAMRRGLRKSFQSLVNWGERNLKIDCIGADNPDRDLFMRYRDFHAAVAGRVTRSEASWDAMFDWIAAGHGELVLGLLVSGELVAGTLVVDGTTTSFYASGVYDRERFDLPLGHWPLWLAMKHSAARGMRTFDLGDLPLSGAATEKELSIAYFKRGFATTIASWIAWSVNVAGAKSAS
jgi:hypothetical protein